jgi:Uma2 family endonuclease
MSTPIPIPRVSREEYLRRERLAEFKNEYHDGEIIAMSGATRSHNRIATNLTASLGTQFRNRRCQNYVSALRVSAQGGKSYLYPDIVVTCGKEVCEDDQFDTLVNPVVVIEILSPATEHYDRGFKFLAYLTIPSLREYVLTTQSPRRFEIYRRRDEVSWLYRSWAFSPPPLVLESIGCTLSADDVYDKVEDVADQEPQRDEPHPA